VRDAFFKWAREKFSNPIVSALAVVTVFLILAYLTGMLQRIASLTVDSVRRKFKRKGTGNGIAPPQSKVRELSSPPKDFVGRAREIRDLRKAARKHTPLIIRAGGGVGKTALALKLAAELRSLFPGPHIHLRLRGTDEPLSPLKAMEHVIRAFRPDYKTPEDEAEVAPLYRSTLHGKRALLLMDNARDADQVRDLAPPEGSLMIVTTRQDFTLPGWFALDLDVLPMQKAVELLGKPCSRIGDDAEEIAELCGCLPLALRLAGGALAVREEIAPADYIADLRGKGNLIATLDKFQGASGAEKKLEASFRMSYELLCDDLKEAWRQLAVFPADFFSVAAAAVWEMEGKAARDFLGDLLSYNLIDYDADTKRWRLHDLARDFAAARLAEDEGERYAAAKRHARHYLAVLSLCNNLYLEGGDETLRGLAVFDMERANIEAGFEWASANYKTNDDAAQTASDYPDAGAYCLDLRQHPRRERIPWLEIALAAARRLEDRKAEAAPLGNLGLAWAALGETRKAIDYFEKPLEIARDMGDRRGEGYDLWNMALALESLGERDEAIEKAEDALSIYEEIEDPNADVVRAALEEWRRVRRQRGSAAGCGGV